MNLMHSYGEIQPEIGRVNELFSNPEISWMHLMQLGMHSYGQIQPEAGRVGVKQLPLMKWNCILL